MRFPSLDPARLDPLRKDTPGAAKRIHLNNAGSSLPPRPVVDAVVSHLELEAEIGGYEAEAAREEEIRGAYAAVADLVGASPDEIAFTESATAAYAQALSSIPFERGDRIVTTLHDYSSNQIMFLALERRLGVELVRAPELPEGGADPEGVARMLAERRPRLVAVTHVPTSSGLVQDVRAIGRACREAGVPYLVDACQSVGQLPIDVGALGCDFLAATSRKFLRGPRGSGFLFVARRVLEAGMEPLLPDCRGAEWTGPASYAPDLTARRFEQWESSWALVLGTGAAARYARRVGIEAIARRVTRLAERLRAGLAEAGLSVLDRGRERCGIVTVAIPVGHGRGGGDPDAFHAALEAAGVNSSITRRSAAVLELDAKGVDWALRLSPHYFVLEDEIDRAVERVAELAARRGTPSSRGLAERPGESRSAGSS